MVEKEAKSPTAKEQINPGYALYLTRKQELLKRQFSGEVLAGISKDELIPNISTDVILPNKAVLSYVGQGNHLDKFALTGLNGINPGDIASGHFQTLVAGDSFARGSSRIHAPLALQEAGIKIVIANSERIFTENCVNLGIYLVSPDSETGAKLLEGKNVEKDDILKHYSPLFRDVAKSGGLLSYFKKLDEGKITPPEVNTPKRPMTIAEKIISNKALSLQSQAKIDAVKPEDEVVATPDYYYGYELQSPPMIKAITQELNQNPDLKIRRDKAFLYTDHTALLWDKTSVDIRSSQSEFAKPLGITVYEADPRTGASAICHTDMVEKRVLPGQLILGNDSHTDTLGSLNCLAIGKGTIDLAGALAYDKMILKVPESIRINLTGELPEDVSMKDFMLWLGARPEFKTERVGSGRIFEYGGEALNNIPFEEQMKLTNMAIELQGYTGIIEPNTQIKTYLKDRRGVEEEEIESMFVYPDEDAKYSHIFNIDLKDIEPMVSTPGDTQNGIPLSEIEKQHKKINVAYIGSCTHGTPEDLRQVAKVLKGRKASPDLNFFIQASSVENLEIAKERGYFEIFSEAGAEVLPIGCGACINAGPGSTKEDEIGLFATNRNFPGRTGKGETYLASPAVTAASAVAGYICSPKSLE